MRVVVHVFVGACAREHVRKCASLRVSVCACVYAHVCMYICTRTRVRGWMRLGQQVLFFLMLGGLLLL